MDLNLKTKFALVTGGSHGIGLATAKALAAEGCNVAICARQEDRIRSAVAALKATGCQAIGIPADVLIPADIERVMKTVIAAWGALHILINNVGGGGRWGKPSIEETTEDVWIDVYNKNAMAAVRFIRRVLPYMRKQKWGRVVTVTSICGREGGGRPWFNMAKSAEISLMKCLSMSKELVRDGLTFNSIAPGAIMIPGTGWDAERKKDLAGFEKMIDALPLGRLGTPEEVAHVIAFLCSDKAGWVNGACITVDGGESRSF
ncbi:MAG: SDR family oxidoreductase [Verrucomicrobia bacterium]|nr:SDR family oxidoreductase [Verrucomicrobiota bacterium]MBU1735458.1 SDR family oxidoreductase [Verrucomicrobiota bacterium]MBU1856853.1 SDR family oxidoreductase [Verrucomicrobiota bacterium]